MRVRIRFTKLGKVRFTSHRDVARLLERAARKAELALTYTQGFSPRPKLSFGLALPTGCESLGEYADLELDEPTDLDALPALLSGHLPPGLDVTHAVALEPGGPSLQECIDRCRWRIELPEVAPDAARAAIAVALERDELVVRRQRKGRVVDDDIRPGILRLDVEPLSPAGSAIVAELAIKPRSVRPGDLIEALDPTWEPVVLRRENQLIATGDVWSEPLAVRPGATPHAEARAS